MKQFRILIVLLLTSLFLGYGTLGLYNIQWFSNSISPFWALALIYISGTLSFFTYSAISVQIIYLTRKYKSEIGKSNTWVLIFLALFLFLCGVGHFIDATYISNRSVDSIKALGKVAATLTTLTTALLFWPLAVAGVNAFYALKKERDSYEYEAFRWTNLPGTLMATQKLQDPNGCYLWVNKEWETLLGWTSEEMASRPWRTFVHPSDVPICSNIDGSKIALPTCMSGYLIRYRHKVDNQDGSPRWVWTRWDAVAFQSTGLVYGSARDVTDQIEASREANITRAHLDNWLTVFPDLLVTVILDDTPVEKKRYLWVSPSCENLLGWTPEELKDVTLVSLIHPEDFNSFLKEYARYDNQSEDRVSKITFRQRIKHKNGEWRWIEWSGVSDHDLKMTYNVGRDITEMVHRQQSLEMSENRFKSVMHNAPIGLALISIDGRWLDINFSLCSIVGYAQQDLLKKSFTEITHPLDLNTDKELIKDLISRKISKYQIVKRCIHKKGHIITLDISTSLVWTGDIPQHFILQVRDLTEEVKQQEEIESHIRDLEQFASVAAHQLKSPPRTIYGMAQALLEDYGNVIGTDGKVFLEDIKQDAENMAEVVDGLYRFSKVRTSSDIEKENVDLNKVINAICSVRKEQSKSISVKVLNVLPIITSNKILIQEVFYNLIDNGLKFNSSEEPSIEITSEDAEYSHVISVKDNGIGIPRAYYPKLFKMFERLHPTYPGTGVGLSVAASIVQKLDGKIEVESEPGQGTTFILYFPK